MTGRRGLLAGVAVLLAAPALAPASALAQGTAEARPRRPLGRKPPPAESAKQPAAPPPSREVAIGPVTAPAPVTTPAPVPNHDRDWQEALPQPTPSLNPSVINRPLPSRGQAAAGSHSELEDRLFRPAPGARLSVPFSY